MKRMILGSIIALILLSLIITSGASGCSQTCPVKSNPPCHSVQGGPSVSGVIVPDSCDCPSDTNFSGTKDVVSPGGPYKICTCL